MIASRDGVAVEVFRARNVYESPLRYEVHGDDLYRIMDEIDERDLDLGVIYHSHTRSDPVPSQTDINMAKFNGQPRFPGTLYLIVGVKDAEPDLRTWSIAGDEITQVELEVEVDA
jgi:proteasome lid subunit RPN8/RPN11